MYERRAIGEKQRRHQRRAIAAGWTLPFSWTDTVSSTLRELQILPPFTHREPSAGRQRRYLSANASAAVPRMALRWCLCSRPADGSPLMPSPASRRWFFTDASASHFPVDASPQMLLPSSRWWLSADTIAAFLPNALRCYLRGLSVDDRTLKSSPRSPCTLSADTFAAFQSMVVLWCFRRVTTARSRCYLRGRSFDGRTLMSSPRSHRTLYTDTFATVRSMAVHWYLRCVLTTRSPLIHSQPSSR
jgi:hypothetical protein